jgi:gas vesicle structural protein
MTLMHLDSRATLIDVLDRVLDKGIVVDAWVRISLAGVDLVMVEARIVIASFETYLSYADTLSVSPLVAAPPLSGLENTTSGKRLRSSVRRRSTIAA